MTRRSGLADLPLHNGRVPAWLASRMARLARVITEAIVLQYGRDEFLARLAHPFWFQSFGAVMGMDWHSSGITTSVLGALKRGLTPVQDELGIYVCGARGRHSRKTPDELMSFAELTGQDGAGLARTSRLVAKVDSAAVQDGFQLYLHAFVITADAKWTVVQQGMLPAQRLARRYHWCSESLTGFLDDPHTAVEGVSRGTIVNLADRRAAQNRRQQLQLVHGSPDGVVAALKQIQPAPEPAQPALPQLLMPGHHDVRAEDVVLKRLRGTLAAAAERGPQDYEDLLLVPGVGARTVEALAHVAEVVHGAPCRFTDPARFSLAHGGKDGHPFPVPLRVYDETLRVLRNAVSQARLGHSERLGALKELDRQARRLESVPGNLDFAEFLERERDRSCQYGGRAVNVTFRTTGSGR